MIRFQTDRRLIGPEQRKGDAYARMVRICRLKNADRAPPTPSRNVTRSSSTLTLGSCHETVGTPNDQLEDGRPSPFRAVSRLRTCSRPINVFAPLLREWHRISMRVREAATVRTIVSTGQIMKTSPLIGRRPTRPVRQISSQASAINWRLIAFWAVLWWFVYTAPTEDTFAGLGILSDEQVEEDF